MKRFKAEIELHVEDYDADVMRFFPDIISDRFAGTAIKIDRVTITTKEEVPSP